ncbi:MAG: Type secretion system permease/ATPase [Cyanobacteria bacterium RYN_339]|nr:Type secretion system permease/ATPase [Cyanobacteria bacterium RYN_339]
MSPAAPRDHRHVAACLAWLTARAGRPLSPERILASLTDGRDLEDGLDLEGIAAALRRAGMAFEPVAPPRGKPTEAQLPALALADPDGTRVVGIALDADGKPEALLFSAETPRGVEVDPGTFAAGGGMTLWRVSALPPVPVGDDLGMGRAGRHWFWSPFARQASTYTYVIVAAVAVNVIGLVSSLYTMAVYDRVIPNNSLVTLWTLSAGVAVAYVVDLVLRVLRGIMIDVASRRMDVVISRDLFDQLLGIRLEYRLGSTGTTANMLREFGTVHDFFSSATLLAVVDVPFVLLYLVVILAIAPACFWPTVAAVPVVVALGFLVQAKLGRESRKAYLDGQEKLGALVETLGALESVRALGAERTMRGRWRDRVGASAMSAWHVRHYQQLAVNVAVTIQQVATLGVVIAGVLAIQEGKLSQGALVAAVILSGRALAPLAQLAQIMSRFNLTRVSMKALTRFFAIPVERPEGRTFLDRPRVRGAYELRDLGFAYAGQPPVPVVAGLNLTIRPGERVGVLGRVGSGKSTLLKLLLGLYQPTTGTLRLDGVDLRQVDPAQLRAQVSYVAQTPVLFSGTVRENIAIARPEASDEEVLRAATLAGCDTFIGRHPLGYDMPLGERGEGLSVGQRQALAIAQAMIKDADVLLMDEPTSAMDDRTEEEFRRRLAAILPGKTLVLVTHKLAALELVDRLIVVDGGRIVVDGPKEQVLGALMGGDLRRHEGGAP